jgi:hypothetical protein
MMRMSYLLPNSSLEVEVSQTKETIILTIRDHALTTPEADPMMLAYGTSANVIYTDTMLKEGGET